MSPRESRFYESYCEIVDDGGAPPVKLRVVVADEWNEIVSDDVYGGMCYLDIMRSPWIKCHQPLSTQYFHQDFIMLSGSPHEDRDISMFSDGCSYVSQCPFNEPEPIEEDEP